MRVIHHDGRVGAAKRVFHEGIGSVVWRITHRYDVWGYQDDLSTLGPWRPLGPIEDELWANPDELSPVPCEAYGVAMDRDPLALSEDIDSELLEACARIWEQHGVAL